MSLICLNFADSIGLTPNHSSCPPRMADSESTESDSTESGKVESLPSSPAGNVQDGDVESPLSAISSLGSDCPSQSDLGTSESDVRLSDSSRSAGTNDCFPSPLKDHDISPPSSPLEHGRKRRLYSLYRDNPLEPVSVRFCCHLSSSYMQLIVLL